MKICSEEYKQNSFLTNILEKQGSTHNQLTDGVRRVPVEHLAEEAAAAVAAGHDALAIATPLNIENARGHKRDREIQKMMTVHKR